MMGYAGERKKRRDQTKKEGKPFDSRCGPIRSDEVLPAIKEEAKTLDVQVAVFTSESLPRFRHWRFLRMGVFLLDYWPGTGRYHAKWSGEWGFVASPSEALELVRKIGTAEVTHGAGSR
jgi:hypothetical protein